jgi:Zincin-like metallopeptidase
MKYSDFEAMIRRLADEVPPHFLEGVSEISVASSTVPHPTRADIYTLGECIPDPLTAESGLQELRSRIVLYHGSFEALAAKDPAFDWNEEAFETLTHELRHHLEWRARSDALEDFDRAAEENYARHDGEEFDPLFYLGGEEVVPGVYQVDDDWFIDRVVRRVPATVEFGWHGAQYQADLPDDLELPVYLVMLDLAEPPPGELVVVLRRKPSLLDLFRRQEPAEIEVAAQPVTR